MAERRAAKRADRDAEVAAFLRADPGFLTRHPEIYRALEPPARVHGERLADHMAAMLVAERAHAEAMAERADGVLAAGRATAGMALRVQEAVLTLIRCDNVADCVSGVLPALLGVDAVSLCIEAELAGARRLAPGQVVVLMGHRAVVFRAGGEDGLALHGEAARLARHEALLRLPGEGPPALVALAVRDAGPLDATQGAGPLGFLARAVAAALGR